ncbi:MAG: hypothetical protein C4295_00235 [Candidatus Fervidibacterota bacterium]
MAGDLEAFDELVCRYRPAVLAAAYQVADLWDDAEDAAPETFLIALKALPMRCDPKRFGVWLHATLSTKPCAISTTGYSRNCPSGCPSCLCLTTPSP